MRDGVVHSLKSHGSGEQTDLVLCVDDRTFEVKQVETSNTLMLFDADTTLAAGVLAAEDSVVNAEAQVLCAPCSCALTSPPLTARSFPCVHTHTNT